MTPPAPSRPRINQPTGYRPSGHGGPGPRYVYGRRHDYIYYPIAWIDSSTGTRYDKGYYDENGTHYDDVSFQTDGKYKNVLCHCPYCEQDTVLDLSAGDIQARKLQCPNCGGNMEIRSELDDAAQGTNAYAGAVPDTAAAEAQASRKRGCLIRILIAFAIVAALNIYGSHLLREQQPEPVPISVSQGSYTDYNQRDTLWLVRSGSGYTVSDSAAGADKALAWDAESESFYDPETEYWLWYNTEVDPPVWQYWIEGISSNYGEYGWMEHDEDGWFIETSWGNWIELPPEYDASGLWYIE